jgi:hypothetical protein
LAARVLRYRAPRFNTRTRKAGWLAPSLQHRVDTTLSLVKQLRRWAPITDLAVELVNSVSWDGPRRNGSSGGAGLSDHRVSVPRDGYYVISSLLDARYGWSAGGGSAWQYTANSIAGDVVTKAIWVR